jgi:hypothetical protein
MNPLPTRFVLEACKQKYMFSIFYCHLTHTQVRWSQFQGPFFLEKMVNFFFIVPIGKDMLHSCFFRFFVILRRFIKILFFFFFPVSESRSHSHRTLINDVFKSILGKCSTGITSTFSNSSARKLPQRF